MSTRTSQGLAEVLIQESKARRASQVAVEVLQLGLNHNRASNIVLEYLKPSQNTGYITNAILEFIQPMPQGGTGILRSQSGLSARASTIHRAVGTLAASSSISDSARIIGSASLQSNSTLSATSAYLLVASAALVTSSRAEIVGELSGEAEVCPGCDVGVGMCCRCRDGTKARVTSRIILNYKSRPAYLPAVEVCRLKQLENTLWRRIQSKL